MLYIDGYNLLFRLDESHLSLLEAREKIILNLNRKLFQLKIEATVVFDSMHKPGSGSHHSFEFLHVIYTSHKESADDWLYHLVLRSKNPHLITIVSSDKKLQGNVRKLKAKTVDIDTFLHWLNKKQLKKKQDIIINLAQPVTQRLNGESKLRAGSLEYYEKIFEERLLNGNFI